MKDREHTPYQKGIIRRFYEHRDTLALQKLGEVVSNLYLETSEGRLSRAWASAEKHLVAAGATPEHARSIVADRDLGALARLVAELS